MADVEIDFQAIGDLLRSQEVADAVAEIAGEVASRVDARGETVSVRRYKTDRAAAAVTIESPRGMLLQARNGALTRAAAAAGLEVTERVR